MSIGLKCVRAYINVFLEHLEQVSLHYSCQVPFKTFVVVIFHVQVTKHFKKRSLRPCLLNNVIQILQHHVVVCSHSLDGYRGTLSLKCFRCAGRQSAEVYTAVVVCGKCV